MFEFVKGYQDEAQSLQASSSPQNYNNGIESAYLKRKMLVS